MSIANRANGSTPLRRLILYIVFVVLGFIYVLYDESFWDIAGKARATADQRNARSLIDIHGAASIAGVAELESATDVTAVVRLLARGVEGRGAFDGLEFKVPLDQDEIERALPYLRLEEGRLVFRSQ